MELRLDHHVFSSEGGYRTMHISPGARPVVKKLEAFAKRIYKKVQREPLYAILRLDGRVAMSKTFVAGSDHVGRLRGCVHTVLPDAEPLRTSPFFNPFDLLGRAPFVSEGVNLLAVSGEMEPAVEFTPATGPVVPRPRVTETLAQAVFMGILSPHHEALASDPTGDVWDLIGQLYPLLPPFIRADFSALQGAYLPAAEDSTRIDFFTLPGNVAMGEFVKAGNLVIDVAHGKLENVPAPSPYCKMVMDACFGRSDGAVLRKFLWLMERNEFSAEPTWDVLQSLFEAFSHVEKLTTDDGRIETSAGPEAALKAMVPFARGGYARLAMKLLRGAAAQAASKSDTGEIGLDLVRKAAAIEGSMEEMKKRPAVLFQRLGQLSDAMLKYFAQRGAAGRKPATDAKKRDEIIDSMLSWDF